MRGRRTLHNNDEVRTKAQEMSDDFRGFVLNALCSYADELHAHGDEHGRQIVRDFIRRIHCVYYSVNGRGEVNG